MPEKLQTLLDCLPASQYKNMLTEAIEELAKDAQESNKMTLLLAEDLQYIAGIVAMGRGQPTINDDLKVRALILGYVQELEADAARYRHIKDNIQVGTVQTMLPLYRVHHWHGYEDAREHPDLDAAIDAAMKKST